jgi:peptidoglycan/LPS O-acetylase OafA/YrhL
VPRSSPPLQNVCAAVQGGSPIGGIAGCSAAARAGRSTHERLGPRFPPLARSAWIDFLRGMAIIVVLLHHFSLTYHLVDSPLTIILPAKLVQRAAANGNYGVTIFFVISGFLITSNNLRRYGRLGSVNLRQFYAFRFSRIIPPLILALAIIVVLGVFDVPSFGNSDGGRTLPASFFVIAVISVLTFWHNVLMEAVGYFNYCLNIYWSLSVEEVFYLTFPLACVLLKRNRYIVCLCICAILVGPIYRGVHRDDELYFMYGYAACFDAIAFGCLTALCYRQLDAGPIASRLTRVAAGVGLAAVYFAGIEGHEVFGFSLVALCSTFFLVGAYAAPDEKSGRPPARMICWFGKHSYELYLFHIIVLAGMRDLVPKGTLSYAYKLPYFALFLLLSALTAGAVSRYLAEPMNAWLRRILARG